MAESLARLLCNFNDQESDVDQILAHLNSSIKKILNEIEGLSSLPDDKLALYGPYLGRSLLELATTAMLAKLDPFRILITKGKQTQPNYELDRPQKASLKWRGDVVGEKVANLWEDKALNNPSRAILGSYSVELVLTKSAQDLLDKATEDAVGEWYQDITSLEAEPLVMKMISRIEKLYSTLSKGIHHELLIPLESVLDRDTVVNGLNETIFVVATLGLVVSFVPHSYARDDMETSFSLYKTAKDLEVS